MEQYRNEFLQYYKDNYEQDEPTQLLNNKNSEAPQVTKASKYLSLARIGPIPGPQFARGRKGKGRANATLNEAEQYLEAQLMRAPENDLTPLQAWATLESEYPTLVKMAQDIFAIPAAEVGVERVFSAGRDLISYRRCRLSATTIEKVMMIRYFTVLRRGQEIQSPADTDTTASDKSLHLASDPPTLDYASDSEGYFDDEPVIRLFPDGEDNNSVIITGPNNRPFYDEDVGNTDKDQDIDLPVLDEVMME